MESWRKVFRDGVVPAVRELVPNGLEILRDALRADDRRITQGSTTTPPLMCVLDWPIEAACLLGFCDWQGNGSGTVGEVEIGFARLVNRIDELVGESSGSRWVLNFWDDTPRPEAVAMTLGEVEYALGGPDPLLSLSAGAYVPQPADPVVMPF